MTMSEPQGQGLSANTPTHVGSEQLSLQLWCGISCGVAHKCIVSRKIVFASPAFLFDVGRDITPDATRCHPMGAAVRLCHPASPPRHRA